MAGKSYTPGAKSGGIAAAVLALGAMVAFLHPWEDPPGGPALIPYKDLIGIWTWCSGETNGPRLPRYTKAQCEAITRDSAIKTLVRLDACIEPELTENQWVAVGDLGYNAGADAICRSTLVRMINQGQPASVWCKQILRWDRAGGRQIKGLTRRREAEYRVCIQ